MASGKSMESAMAEVAEAKLPKLEAWSALSPAVLSAWVKKEMVMTDKWDWITPAEQLVIYCTASAANNSESCLSFHAMSMRKANVIEESDLQILMSGGVPQTERLNGDLGRLKNLVIATKYCLAHKGIFLERENIHLESLGFDKAQMREILFITGHIYAVNMLSVSLNQDGIPLEEVQKAEGPFAQTVYKK